MTKGRMGGLFLSLNVIVMRHTRFFMGGALGCLLMGSKQVVASLREALALNEHSVFADAMSWAIAPLLQPGGGGKRAWLTVAPDNSGWIRCEELPENAEDIGIDVEPDALPKLPPSPTGTWAFSFLRGRGSPMKPEILISTRATRDTDGDKGGKSTGKSPRAETLLAMNTSTAQANNDARQATQQSLATLGAVTKHYEALLDKKDKEIARLDALLASQALEIKALNDEKSNLLIAITQLHGRSPALETLGRIFESDPKMLVDGMRDLLGGIMARIDAGTESKAAKHVVGKVAAQVIDATVVPDGNIPR